MYTMITEEEDREEATRQDSNDQTDVHYNEMCSTVIY